MYQDKSVVLDDPSWLTLLERLGLPIFLILFGCAIVWKLLPHVIDWFKANATSAKVVAAAVPDMKESLHKMANDGQRKIDAIDSRTSIIEQRTSKLEEKQDEILARLPHKKE